MRSCTRCGSLRTTGKWWKPVAHNERCEQNILLAGISIMVLTCLFGLIYTMQS